jgi:hypothetical protein
VRQRLLFHCRSCRETLDSIGGPIQLTRDRYPKEKIMAVESDFVAKRVTVRTDGTAGELPDEPVVTFCGWVNVADDVVRVYVEPHFEVWHEVRSEDVVHQMTSDENPQYDGRSVLWVRRGAAICTCTRKERMEGTAGFFADLAEASFDKPPPPRR